MKIIPLKQDSHWEWAKHHIGMILCEDSKGIVAVGEEGRITGMVVFDSWTHTAVMAHFAIPNPMAIRAGLLEEGYRYIFNGCGRKMILGATPTDKTKALKLLAHMGWEEMYRLKDGFAEGVDMVYSRFTREQWLQKRAA